MTITEAKKYLEDSPKEGLYGFTIFHHDPICEGIDVRVGYFLSYFEGKEWAEHICDRYEELKIPYCYYIDVQYERGNGDIETGEWREF